MTSNPAPAGNTTEYLANERTYLAWLRTSIAVMSLGFVVAKFSVWMHELGVRFDPGKQVASIGASLPIGVTMMALGGFLALVAALHYRAVNKAIERGDFRASFGLVSTVTFAAVLLAAAMIASMLSTADIM